jgi:omega-6 fatty acid desaturase (delta-12 desaturase)
MILALGHALSPERPAWLLVLLGWALPFVLWNYLGALSFYLNHTHPDVPWFDQEAEWRRHGGALGTTLHLKMPIDVLPLYSACMAHTAHHHRPSTPIYHLGQAQLSLKQQSASRTHEYTFSIREYRRILAACKLFDFQRMCWTDFSGVRTTPCLVS